MFFAQFSATGAAGGGTAFGAAIGGVGITLNNIIPLREGVTIKNMNTTSTTMLRIYGSSADTGANRYYMIGGLDELFVGCTNPANIFVRNDVAGTGIVVSVYGR